MGLTAAEMRDELGEKMNDPQFLVWTQSLIFKALNTGQREVISFLLSNGTELQHYTDILSEVQEIEDVIVPSQGFVLSGLLNRTFLRNGFINSSIVDNDGITKWPERVEAGNLGTTSNRFVQGTAEDPKCFIFANKYNLQLEVGSFPKTVTFYYIGEPKDISPSQDSELNPILHDIILKFGEVELRRLRGDTEDFQQASFVLQMANQQLVALSQGAKIENQTHNTASEFPRKQDELISNQQG